MTVSEKPADAEKNNLPQQSFWKKRYIGILLWTIFLILTGYIITSVFNQPVL